jgi:hypothetical protein
MATLAAAEGTRAAEPAEQTPPERLHTELAALDGQTNKLLAARWEALIRQRQWTDKTGNYKVYARYVDHDPNLTSVTLLVMTKTGDQLSFREKTVPLDKLGRSEQALVKRIALVRQDVEQALAKSPDGALPSTGETGLDPGQVVDMAEGETAATLDAGAGYPGRELAASPPEPAPVMIGAPAWRSDFQAFASNLSAQAGPDGKWLLSWGELRELQALHETERQLAALRAMPAAERPPQGQLIQMGLAYGWARGGLGEVVWETTLAGPLAADAAELQHDLQLPEPFKIKLVPADGQATAFRSLRPGDRVRLAGRFTDLGGGHETPELSLSVRFLETVLAGTPVEAAADETVAADESEIQYRGPVLPPASRRRGP